MKKKLFILSMSILTLSSLAQESMFTISGGYALGKPENYDNSTSGYRINALYEYRPNNGILAQGFSFGYIHSSATVQSILDSKEITINSLPLYYAPKVLFGKDKLKGFVKGAIGGHFSNYISTGSIAEIKGSDFGVFLGLGAGAMYFLNEQWFLNIEYEWDFMSNTYYNDGFVQTFQLGIGSKF